MKKTAVKAWSGLFVLLMLNLATAGCSAKATATGTPLKIGVLPIEDNLPLYIAESENLFKKAYLNVALVSFDSAAQQDRALSAGQIDGAAGDIVAAALLQKAGTATRIGAVTLGAKRQEGRIALLLAPKSKIKSIAELKNKAVGISENTIVEFVADRLLHDGGLPPSQVHKVSIENIPVRLEMLLSGKIDAAFLPDPVAALAEFQGARVISDDTYTEISQSVLLFREESMQEKKAAIKELIRIYGQAGQMLTDQPGKYRQMLTEKAKMPTLIYDLYRTPTFSALQLPDKDHFAAVNSWMVEKGLLSKAFAYDDLVDRTLLPD